jgi:hypothetical protein
MSSNILSSTGFKMLLLIIGIIFSLQPAFSQELPEGDKIIKCLGQEVMSSDVFDMILDFEMKDDVVPDANVNEDYQSFYIDNLTVSIKFTSAKQKKIEFIQFY